MYINYMKIFERIALSTSAVNPSICFHYVDNSFETIHEYDVKYVRCNNDPNNSFPVELEIKDKLPFFKLYNNLLDDGLYGTTARPKSHSVGRRVVGV